MGRKNPKWSVSRSVSVTPDDARLIDAMAESFAKGNKSVFLREVLMEGLVAKFGEKWRVYADALIAERDAEAA